MRELLKTWALVLSISFASMIGLIDPTTTEAEIKIIEADGMYIMGDGTKENPAVAKERAREDAKRAASEKASVYVESLSEVRKGQVTQDVIRTISSNVLEVQSSDVNVEVADGNALIFRCHIVARVDSEQATGQLKKDGSELAAAARRNKELESQIAKVNSELADLKTRYVEAQNEAEKNKIREQLRINEQKFTASQLFERGNSLMQGKDFYAAIGAYRESLISDPSNAFAYNNLGFAFELTGHYDEAADNYRKAVGHDEHYAGAYYNLGNMYFRNREYQSAIENYNRTIEIDSQFLMAYNNLGLVYANLQQYDPAIETFTRAIENASDKSGRAFAELFNNRGTCYQQLQKFDAALSDYEEAMKTDPNYSDPHVNRDNLKAWLDAD